MQIFFHLIIFAILLLGVHTVFAQSHPVTEAELKQLIVAAIEKRKGLPQRHKTATSGYTKGTSSETLTEYGPNDSYHYVVIRKSNGEEIRTEGIGIGDVRYTREKEGGWIKEPLLSKTAGGGSGMGSAAAVAAAPPETKTEYIYLGQEKVNGLQTKHYRKTQIVRFTSQQPILVRKTVDDYWFGKDGLLVKESGEDAFENSKQTYKSVTMYEYPRSIEITAPITN